MDYFTKSLITSHPEILVEYNPDDTKKYIGYGLNNAAEDDHAWLILEMSYDANQNCIKTELLNKSSNKFLRWVDRAGTPTPTRSELPVIEIIDTLYENDTIIGTITNHTAGTTYTFESDLGSIVYVSGNTFEYTAPNLTRDIQINIFVSSQQLNKSPSVYTRLLLNLKNRKTLPIPKITFPSEVIKNTSVIGIILNPLENQIYTITCLEGTINYPGKDVFEYTAPNVVGNTPDTIEIIGSIPGYDNTVLDHNIIILDQYERTTQKPNIMFPLEVEESSVTEGNILGWEAANTYDIIENDGTISSIVNGVFTFTANAITSDTITSMSIQATAPNMNPSEYSEKVFMINNVMGITPEPTLSISTNILEETTTEGTITNYIAGTTYTITAIEGTISNIVDDTFDYTASEVTTDTVDIISIIAHVTGDEDSIQLNTNITIDNKITPTPILSIVSNITEETTTQGIITNHIAGTTYTIIAVEGSISDISGGIFSYIASEVTEDTPDVISIIAHVVGDENSTQLDHDITIDNRVTPTPILNIASNVLEETTEQGTITNYVAGTTYTITAIEGTISNVVDDTFDYTAPAVTEDTPDTISIIAHVIGDEDSIQLDTNITIDNTIINN